MHLFEVIRSQRYFHADLMAQKFGRNVAAFATEINTLAAVSSLEACTTPTLHGDWMVIGMPPRVGILQT